MRESRSPIKQRPGTEHVQTQGVHAGNEDPFSDDTYAIGDEEVDDTVGARRDSREMADISTSRTSHRCGDNDLYAIGDEEVDNLVGVLRSSGEVAETSRARSRQAWVEDADR